METYDIALPILTSDPAMLAALRACRSSHHERVALLRDAVTQADGAPIDTSGAWGAFARAVEGGARKLGASIAVKAR